ncbi:hypothetical protein PSN45_003311 [Yamadazyma tenuis]|nr:hypothetical protein PSN45_003311 [Yamadazyma tenuis]
MSAIVDHVRHAISLDERRGKFKQVMFKSYSYLPHLTDVEQGEYSCEGSSETNSLLPKEGRYLSFMRSLFARFFGDSSMKNPKNDHQSQDTKEVVFPGNHGDVGGGWLDPDTDHMLSNIPLRWMLSYAIKYGISFKPEAIEEFNTSFSATSSLLAHDHDMLKLHTSVTPRYIRELPDRPIQGNNGFGTSSAFQMIMWWAVELFPIGIKIEDEWGQWRNWYVPNLGRPRKFPSDIHLHWSVFYRMHFFEDYSPKNLPPDLKTKFLESIKPFEGNIESQQLQELLSDFNVEKIKGTWENKIWHQIPDELCQTLNNNQL